jgi:hypothetical protein
VAAEYGIVGFVLLGLVTAWAILWCARSRAPTGPAALAMLTLFLLHAQFDYVLHEGALAVVVAFAVGAAPQPGQGRARATIHPWSSSRQ